MQAYTIHPQVASSLIEREIRRVRRHIKKYEKKKIAIFAAGEYGCRFAERLSKHFGVEAEFFIDNNPLKTGTIVSGKPVLLRPWENVPDFARKYFVLIATSARGTAQISVQLTKAGIPHMSSDAYEATLLAERAKKVVQLLDDDFSKASYLGLMWYWLTHDNSLSQSSDHPYFAVKPFMYGGATALDLGAFIGDFIEEYIRRSIGIKKIYAFEPDEKNRSILSKRVERWQSEWGLNDEMISIIAAGASSVTGIQYFRQDEQKRYSSTLSDEGENAVQVYALDDFFEDKQPPTLIKADIEGAEQGMLRGAMRLIQKHKPRMALSIYHLADDFVRIPEMIHDMNDAYSFAVRTHSAGYNDTVLYCY